MTDVDIDFADSQTALETLQHIPAMLVDKFGQRKRHQSGVYFQNIPVNPLNGLAAFTYEEADSLGYFKVDFLNQSVYEDVRDEAHLDELLNTEPEWDLLLVPEIVSKLVHVRNHLDILQIIQPRSIADVALVLALIRPGKRHLLNKPRQEIEREIWNIADGEAYSFKRSHAVSYAALVVVHLNLICEQLLSEHPSG